MRGLAAGARALARMGGGVASESVAPDAARSRPAQASLRADTSDLQAFVEALAVKLEDLLPGGCGSSAAVAACAVQSSVSRITIDAGDRRLELVNARGVLQTRGSRVSGGYRA